jgi:hypothetical protein
MTHNLIQNSSLAASRREKQRIKWKMTIHLSNKKIATMLAKANDQLEQHKQHQDN